MDNEIILSEELKKAFMNDLLKNNFTYPAHSFSLRYKLRKKRIIDNNKKEQALSKAEATGFRETKAKIPLKRSLTLAFLIIVLMAVLEFTVYRCYSGFYVREYDIFSMLSVKYDENSPKVLTEKFYIDMDLSEFDEKVLEDNDLIYWIQYKKDEEVIDIMQSTLEVTVNVRLNTENAMIMPTNISVNGWDGMYYQAYDGSYVYYFNCKDYIMSYITNLPLSEIDNLVKATKFK